MTIQKHPKAFISYAWTDDDHVSRVLALAQRLTEDGVEVIIDKWDLKAGQDAFKFMEKLVGDPSVTHALMISNRTYAEKADSRTGGAGTEAQIISPAIYASTNQEKFVLVAFELDADGNPFVPTFYKGRIYINLADEVGHETEYDRLIRALWGKPLHKRPALGSMPAHLNEDREASSFARSAYLRASSEIRQGKPSAVTALKDFRDQVLIALESHRLQSENEENFDDKVVESIDRLKPLVDEVQLLVTDVARAQNSEALFGAQLTLLEGIQVLSHRPPDLNRWDTRQFDNFKFIASELMLVTASVLLKEGRFDLFRVLTTHRYTSIDPSLSHRGFTHDFSEFSHHIGSLEVRNARLKLNRASVFGDMLLARHKSSSLTFGEITQADLLLFLADVLGATKVENGRPTWWPVAVMRDENRYAPVPLFARAESKQAAKQIAGALGLDDISAVKDLVTTAIQQRWLRPRGYFDPELKVLTNFDRLGLFG